MKRIQINSKPPNRIDNHTRYNAPKKSIVHHAYLASDCYDCRGGPCRKYGKRHNLLLHVDEKGSDLSTSFNSNKESVSINIQSHTSSYTFVSTAIVDIVNNQGQLHACRVMLDNGLQSHYITDRMASLLKLPRKPVNIAVTGLNLASTDVRDSVSTIFKSRFNKFQRKLNFLVFPHVKSKLPSVAIDCKSLRIPQHIKLADSEFHKPAEIDALIGVQLYYMLLCAGQIDIQGHDAVLQKTHLGWIIAGDVCEKHFKAKVNTCHLTMNPINTCCDEQRRRRPSARMESANSSRNPILSIRMTSKQSIFRPPKPDSALDSG